MTRRGREGRGGDVDGQLHIDWVSAPNAPPETPDTAADAPGLVQYLPWEFANTFPSPTDAAIAAGIVSDGDLTPEGIRGIHDEHSREALTLLHDLDALMSARRRGVDPTTGKPPRTPKAREQLQKRFEDEPRRLESAFRALLDVYADAFGAEAAEAFEKAIRARHAGIPVRVESRDQKQSAATKAVPVRDIPKRRARISVRLPVPKPLASAVAIGTFGLGEDGKPIRPGPYEVREITERHAQYLIDLLESVTHAAGSCAPTERTRLSALFDEGIARYAQDFGERAAQQLEAHVRWEASRASESNVARSRTR